jgi:hypothetical protein
MLPATPLCPRHRHMQCCTTTITTITANDRGLPLSDRARSKTLAWLFELAFSFCLRSPSFFCIRDLLLRSRLSPFFISPCRARVCCSLSERAAGRELMIPVHLAWTDDVRWWRRWVAGERAFFVCRDSTLWRMIEPLGGSTSVPGSHDASAINECADSLRQKGCCRLESRRSSESECLVPLVSFSGCRVATLQVMRIHQGWRSVFAWATPLMIKNR